MAQALVAESTSLGMGTVLTHRAYGQHAEEALRAVGDEAVRLEGLLSRFRPASEISAVNRSAGRSDERVSPETFAVLSRAAEFSQASHGLFDPTVGPLVDLWGIGRGATHPPQASRIRQTLPLVDYRDLVLDPDRCSAGLRRAGQSLDLGGVGKGYAGDRFLEILKDHGVSCAFVNLGGNVVGLGARPDGAGWRVGIRHPRQEESLVGVVAVRDKAVVTSGDYQRYFTDRQGQRFHHILDPSTGYPAASGLISVTVVAESSLVADALSTMAFVAGTNGGLDLIRQFPGMEAIFIDVGLRVRVTEGLEGLFHAAEGVNVEIV